jgi:hypothetical protein
MTERIISNQIDVVKKYRRLYNNYKGEQRAYLIINATAWELRGGGAGLFFKDAGTRYADRSVDVIMFKPENYTYDVLRDAPNKCEPAWSRTRPTGQGDPRKWRAPIDPATLPPPLTEPVEPEEPKPDEPHPPENGDPPPVTPTVDLATVVAILRSIEDKHDELKKLVMAPRQVRIKTTFGDITGTIDSPGSPVASSDTSD